MPAHDLKHRVGGRPLRKQHCRGANRHGKRHGVPHAVREKKLCRGEHNVVLANADDALAHQPRRRHKRGVDVLDPLGVASGAGCIHPECDLVGKRRRDEYSGRSPGHEVGKIVHIAFGKRGPFLRAGIDENDRAQPRQPIEDGLASGAATTIADARLSLRI